MKNVSWLLKLSVIMSLVYLFTVAVYAATLEVGPPGYPYTSIQAAINDADTGDTVLVHDAHGRVRSILLASASLPRSLRERRDIITGLFSFFGQDYVKEC